MDLQILHWVNDNLHGSAFFNKFVYIFSFLGEIGAVWIVIGILLLCFKRTRRAGVIYAVCLVLDALIVNLLIKNLVQRPRPYVEDATLLNFLEQIGARLPGEYSFPSGHAAVSFAGATALTLLFGKRGAWFYILAVLISLSRIFLLVHYPSDVLCGAIFGTACAFLGYWICRLVEKKIAKNKQK